MATHLPRPDHIRDPEWDKRPSPGKGNLHPHASPDDHLHTEYYTINMGPSHPATHGTVRFELTLDGETVVEIDPHIGYLHRGFEKMSEVCTYNQVLPYTDRLNYVSPLCNNVGWSMTVEKALGITTPDRCQYIRMIACELSRISDHLTAVSAGALELGGFTPFLYGIQAREIVWDRIEELTGARLTTAYTRVGGLNADIPAGWEESVDNARKQVEKLVVDVDKLLTRNRIFYDRMAGVGAIAAADAIDLGFTGPCLRSTGVDYDVRTYAPYLLYDRVEFDVPVGTSGDNYDRYLVRLEEMRQSWRIIAQCFAQMEPGPISVGDWKVVLPPKDAVYNTIEGMIAHFKLIMEGVRVPSGEVYGYVEGGNGEVGFYVVSDGSGRPWRVKVRPPCFALMQGLRAMTRGALLADIIPTFDTINMIGGEIDR
ncbi:MAG: NADH-quinone oxidoreductase subunit D [Deltaproteobacteria bacterium]|nr:NADH-quinone oxidoreductase subunit D [Deltaproteobacteria bacterium]MCB9786405.1 NADH-quinone oxidoreductase subunit D [Deltaproteobacteria bacterium]